MSVRIPKTPVAGIILALALSAGLLPGQQPLPAPGQPGAPAAGDANGTDVLARGPVHEAYADTYSASAPTPTVAKQPPDAIDELPPDHKPDGNNVQWVPGYWHWDEDRNDFSWISGFWRSVPPGRVWVPGSWRGVQTPQGQSGWQWAPGFWQEAPVQQAVAAQAAPQHEVQYLPQPPATLEAGPGGAPAPTATSFYMPGGWVWRDGRYAWRPGTWYEYRAGWVWVPGYYRWTPVGYVYVEGYWDYPLGTRGVIYAPMAYSVPLYARPGYVYTPTYVVSEQCMMGAMFVRRGWGCYYFGDYYGPQYATGGYGPWCGTIGPGGTFVVGYGRAWGYDPLWSYYSVAYRDSPRWREGMGTLYVGRFGGTIAPPPVSLSLQIGVLNRYGGGMTVVGGSLTVGGVNVSGLAMVAPARLVVDLHPEMRISPLPMEGRRNEMMAAREMRRVAADRMRHENEVVRRGGGIPRGAADVHSMKVEASRAAVARAQARDERRPPPENPHAAAAAHANTPVGHGAEPGAHPDPKAPPVPGKGPNGVPGKVDPKNDPKHDPRAPQNRDRDSKGESRP